MSIINGNRASGYIVRGVPSDQSVSGKIETIETRMCVHCGAQWIYKPGSGRLRGWCLKCNGLLCGKQECIQYHVPLEARIDYGVAIASNDNREAEHLL